MDGINIIDFIQQLGFPIAMCCALFWYMYKQNQLHREETDKLRDTIEANTRMLTRLYERLGGEHEHAKEL